MRKSSKRARSDREVILNVTKKEYEKEIASGVDPKDALKPGKHVFRRGRFFERHGVTPEEVRQASKDARSSKLVITVRLDADVVAFFKQRAEKPGAPGYQTQMNDALRAFMEGGKDLPAGAATFLENETFIEALADKVQKKVKRSKISA